MRKKVLGGKMGGESKAVICGRRWSEEMSCDAQESKRVCLIEI